MNDWMGCIAIGLLFGIVVSLGFILSEVSKIVRHLESVELEKKLRERMKKI
jgi:hypothetical protein